MCEIITYAARYAYNHLQLCGINLPTAWSICRKSHTFSTFKNTYQRVLNTHANWSVILRKSRFIAQITLWFGFFICYICAFKKYGDGSLIQLLHKYANVWVILNTPKSAVFLNAAQGLTPPPTTPLIRAGIQCTCWPLWFHLALSVMDGGTGRQSILKWIN